MVSLCVLDAALQRRSRLDNSSASFSVDVFCSFLLTGFTRLCMFVGLLCYVCLSACGVACDAFLHSVAVYSVSYILRWDVYSVFCDDLCRRLRLPGPSIFPQRPWDDDDDRRRLLHRRRRSPLCRRRVSSRSPHCGLSRMTAPMHVSIWRGVLWALAIAYCASSVSRESANLMNN